MKNKILIYGAGGLGLEMVSLIRALPDWEVEGFIDDNVIAGSVMNGVRVLGGIAYLKTLSERAYLIIAIGNPNAKRSIQAKIVNPVIQYPVLIHPAAILQDETTIVVGEGSVIAAGTILTCDIKVGRHVLLNLQCTVGHHTTIGDFVSVMPGSNISGNVKIGNEVLIGSGVNIINNITLGDECVVGMGAAVIQEVPPAVTVVGVPAKIKA